MNELDAFLRTDPRDVSCGRAMDILHVYAELVAQDPVVAAARFPGVAAHIRACGPCDTDLDGLLELLQDRA